MEEHDALNQGIGILKDLLENGKIKHRFVDLVIPCMELPKNILYRFHYTRGMFPSDHPKYKPQKVAQIDFFFYCPADFDPSRTIELCLTIGYNGYTKQLDPETHTLFMGCHINHEYAKKVPEPNEYGIYIIPTVGMLTKGAE